MSGRVAFVTGITGQDGSYLAEHLLGLGYSVHGLVRANSGTHGSSLGNIKDVFHRLTLHKGDVLDVNCLIGILKEIQPEEIYHLAAQSHVTTSFRIPDYTFQVNTVGCLNILQAILHCDLTDKTKLYNAATSELYGGVAEAGFLSERSPFRPRSPYAVSKLSALWLVRNYRAAHGIFAVNGILFNHESPRRNIRFVTTRIARGVARYYLGLREQPIKLASVDVRRDWGHARDYVYGMWLMLQQSTPEDMILASGESRSIREFVEEAFQSIRVRVVWQGADADLRAVNAENGDTLVEIDSSLGRPVEVECLRGDSSLARTKIGWKPQITFKELVREMVGSEIRQNNTCSIL
ncbi:GDP-mannose 4,6-dehydratase [Zopfia rhizophila CBS 207.26]|uniref:GDP-mannose 4,6-dehydratase n=1 Tax=Zopfia rhizophila CBS 207.26 TaxID=1314779 RepID=A0A6A6DHL0_9PEZI|nr:GDP-mannose 4,6-dehydratase [Zopfia rhizophila CBS 207.26]